MEGCRIFKKVLNIPLSHLPTLMLAIGYPIYWIEMYYFDRTHGQTTVMATIIFSCIAACLMFRGFYKIPEIIKSFRARMSSLTLFQKGLLITASGFALIIMLCGFYASLLPPHLVQESDALNYHITLPRQHLIMGSFKHLPWSMADLYFIPMDFALAPYWLATELPNKMPQFLFVLGVIAIAVDLTRIFSRDNLVSCWVVLLAIIGSHNFAIQLGTAMMDVVMCYLILAALHSFIKGRLGLCALEFAFYFWSKSFIPIQITLIFLSMYVLYFFLTRIGFKSIAWNVEDVFSEEQKSIYRRSLRRLSIYFVVLSLLIGGPFIIKSLEYAQTPLFPFCVGSVRINDDINKRSVAWGSLIDNAKQAVNTRDQYGSGRSLREFLRHLWLIAVPEKGVNNRYDYPVGLIYLLCLGPFIFSLINLIGVRKFSIILAFICLYWGTWWMGTHQSRFLFVPILLMVISVLSQPKYCSPVLIICITLALIATSFSVIRAHRRDFGKPVREVLRPKDWMLLEMSSNVDRSQPVILEFPDAAFSDFAVDVINDDSVFVIKR